MMRDEPAPPPPTLLAAMLMAAGTTLATALVAWGVDELRERYGTAKKQKDNADG